MEEIRDILRRIVERSPELRDRLILSEVSSSWREVVGDKLARLSKPVHFSAGVLTISLFDARFKKEFSDFSSIIISRLNERLGKALISEVKVIVKGE
ncbi:MAG: DUF721 domain-containing protein [Acidobacteria bacterium]|nr:DUF721 domain-containing protein [Acidobacteriota bacterium]